MKEEKYTLSQLCYLSRCLFIDDFNKELIALGVDKFLAYNLSNQVMDSDGRHLNIIELYQINISSNEYTNIINAYCGWFFKQK